MIKPKKSRKKRSKHPDTLSTHKSHHKLNTTTYWVGIVFIVFISALMLHQWYTFGRTKHLLTGLTLVLLSGTLFKYRNKFPYWIGWAIGVSTYIFIIYVIYGVYHMPPLIID